MEITDIDSLLKEWKELTRDYKVLEGVHTQYVSKLEELSELQGKCVKEISHQRYRIGQLKRAVKKLEVSSQEEEEKLNNLEKDVMRRKSQLYDMEQLLPKQNGLYLKIILGNVNVSILNKNDKFKYKDEYEKFKLVLSGIGFALSLINLFTNYRVLDLCFMFLLVWYYCTLTIRESILKVNGSRIKGWWRTHHFISTVLSAVLLVWPTSEAYYSFRGQFMLFNAYISFVQFLQFRYQQGVLYRLKSLGERHNMDITIEGFHSWMWRGLSFLLPFLYIGYIYQFYNAYTLFILSLEPGVTWQVPVLSVLFFTLFLGNTVTTSMVIPQKQKDKLKLKYRFSQFDKIFWNHSRSGSRTRDPSPAVSAEGSTKDNSLRDKNE